MTKIFIIAGEASGDVLGFRLMQALRAKAPVRFELIAVNLTANWRLVRAVEPLLRASDAGRAIFVTSGVSRGRAFWGTYAVTTAALEAMATIWAQGMASTGPRINLINPGPVRTRMRGKAYPGEDPMTLRPPEAVTEAFVALAEKSCQRHGEVVQLR